MAFSLSKVLGFLKKFLSTMSSPLGGFDINDVKVNESDGEFSVLYQFKPNGTSYTTTGEEDDQQASKEQLTNIKNEILELDVLIQAINVKEVFDPLLSAINKLTPDNVMGDNKVLDILLGPDRDPNNLSIQDGKGLLGVDLTQGSTMKIGSKEAALNFAGKTWTWGYILDYLKYALECAAPGKDYGAISDINYQKCGNLIGEYLVKMGVITNANEIELDVNNLLRPILVRIQYWLQGYYDDACKKYLKDLYTDSDNTDNNTDNNQNDNSDNNQDNNSESTDEQQNNTSEQATENTLEQPTKEGEPVNTNPNSSKHIDVTLQKITGTTSFDMTMIKANYSPSLVLADMDEIISQPEFIENLPEEPTTYSIDVDDEGFDIETCEGDAPEADPCASLCEVFKAGIRAYRNLYIIHWMSKGNDMMKLHLMAEDMYEELIKEIDTLGELLVEKQGTVPQLDFSCDYVPVQDYDFQSGLLQIESLVQMYIDCIDYAYCNQDSDVQSTLDEWLRYWKKQTKYFIERQEI